MRTLAQNESRFLQGVGVLSLLTLGRFAFRWIITGTTHYLFVPGNLALAWVALAISWLLIEQLKTHAWSNWRNLVLTILWLFFLPNCWYVLSDYVHVLPTGEISQLYDVVLVGSL